MEIDLQYLEKKFLIRSGIVIHAGANMCQERKLYKDSRLGPIYWIEAIPKYVELSRQLLVGLEDQFIIEAAIWSKSGLSKVFNISSNEGLSSSLFKMKWHRALQPSISLDTEIQIVTTSIDDLSRNLKIANEKVAILVLDLQGAELEALKGAQETLKNTLSIHCEVSRTQLYKSQPTFKEIDEFLNSAGFILVGHDLVGENYSGDALYVRKELTPVDKECVVPEDLPGIRLSARGWIKYRLVQMGFPARFLTRGHR